jgi:NADH-quinone oxidoreductase subunit E
MLTETIRQEILDHSTEYPYKRAACIDALKIVQREHGWVSNENLKEVAGLLEMTPDELDNVATFYNLIFRQPVGKHVILLCDSVSCWIMGYPKIRDQIRQRLGIDFGQTTADGNYTFLPIVCLGDCDHAPVMMVDEDHHNGLNGEKVSRILEMYRKDPNGNTPHS